ncbi:Rop guanine nucleotide exchange factor like [Actinidia chinensis var. chinensis]|uniref:Rop guanine nucleotide exchange factor like n=1 Tax=Actinidia chinensis var. chinensis TaxID=1590841 RepID=A0A2R6QFT9_ACTCC|nr:Rop guanine nucleotide exchange factor like [Actinidia chinensis var. chinensis]
MVRALEEEQAHFKSRLFHFRGMHENAGRKAQSEILESSGPLSPMELDRVTSRSQASKPVSNEPVVGSKIDTELMKERFAKLLLGEDMSGGGKGVSSALALSNAITNLAASVFGEQKRLEPMAPERRARWRKEIDWLLSVTDHIVEMVPSKQISKDGTNMEIMTTRQRTDLHMNIPALRKLDAMLIDCQDNFKDQNEFSYVSKDEESEKGKTKRKDDKWWIPTPKVPPNGLSEVTKKWLQFQKDSVNQVLKAAMAINAQVLSEMAIPENYIDSLPKNGRASLGDSIYKSITGVDYFDPDHFLSTMDLSSEHKILDLKNRIEASVVIWKRKMNAKDGKSPWSSAVSLEKRELFEDRAETVLLIIKQRFPGLPQSALDISKIQYNQDVGQAVLESYSRILESLAYTVISRIEDVLHADSLAQNPSLGEQKRNPLRDSSLTADKFPNAREELEKLNLSETPTSMTLSDFMGWALDQGDAEMKKDSADEWFKDNDAKPLSKPPNVVTNKKFSYIENLGGLRSPTARH